MPSLAVGRTPISIENASGSPWPGTSSAKLMSGSPIGAMPAVSMASMYHSLSDERSASSKHRLATEAADDDGRRHLALAEAGDAKLAAELAGGLLQFALDLVGGNLGVHAHA